MKKVLPYILIFAVVLNLFMPFGMRKDFSVSKNEAKAENVIKIQAHAYSGSNMIRVKLGVYWEKNNIFTNEYVGVTLFKDGNVVETKQATLLANSSEDGNNNQAYVADFTNLIPETNYQISSFAVQSSKSFLQIVTNFNGVLPQIDDKLAVTGKPDIDPLDVKTLESGNTTTLVSAGTQSSTNDYNSMPSCGLDPSTWFPGCVAVATYYVLFVPTSAIFALTGIFFDNTFAYSVNSAAYQSKFVTEGWGIMRDLCNMFFIFILLYIAFSTILNVHGFKTKEMIINVVIIGLVINFSLFATQLIIDASNITARLFYNSDAITITEKESSNTSDNIVSSNTSGVIPLSVALVNKVNPQNLIINAGKVNAITDKAGKSTTESVTARTFLLVTILATAVNVIGIIVFISVGIIFVARVVGLWLAMIFAPLAFLTYAVPSLQDSEMFGWKKWWPETLKLAFLAPFFMFFMYIILKFLEAGLGILDADSKTGLSYVVATLIPFAFIMILLMKAKDLAKKMSGSTGQMITSAISKVGGLALGAGLGGIAMAGRGTIGRLANKVGGSGWVNDAASGKKGGMAQLVGKGLKNISSYGAKSSFDFRQTGAGSAFSKETGLNLNTGTGIIGLDSKKTAGGYIAQQQRKLERHEKFGEALGYDHHAYDHAGDEISKKEADLAEYKASGVDLNDKNIKTEIQKRENDIAKAKKDQERIKTARKNEYALSVKKKSGKIYDIEKADKEEGNYYAFRDSITSEDVERMKKEYENEADIGKKNKLKGEYEYAQKHYNQKTDLKNKNDIISNKKRDVSNTKIAYERETDVDRKKTLQTEYENAQRGLIKAQKEYQDAENDYKYINKYRDSNGNIKKFGNTEKSVERGAKNIIKETLEGVAKGAATGAAIGSVVPGVGTMIGAGVGTAAGAVRSLLNYSGTTNRKVGGEIHKEAFNDNYKAPSGGGHSAPAPSAPSGGGSHDDKHH